MGVGVGGLPGLCLCHSSPLVSSFQLCETLLRAITTGLSGEGEGGSGCVFGSSGPVQNTSGTTPSLPGSNGSFSHRGANASGANCFTGDGRY